MAQDTGRPEEEDCDDLYNLPVFLGKLHCRRALPPSTLCSVVVFAGGCILLENGWMDYIELAICHDDETGDKANQSSGIRGSTFSKLIDLHIDSMTSSTHPHFDNLASTTAAVGIKNAQIQTANSRSLAGRLACRSSNPYTPSRLIISPRG
ncbi:hypothetical protein PGT21_005289 [Puccinia graminis f. sp. tritici]|uniref:Uncharacterized protein n=1 Tax=Puccinia graminis f. sp. tritici TaxID=56615 RepID=A0A5B0PR57_PUCGR|nr:hypothetical protein PGT21_005289 [Puccinia graminis f. sp. tritici]